MIPLFKVKMSVWPATRGVESVFKSGFIGQGEVVEQFEREFSSFAKAPFISMNSCTSSIQAVLMMLGVGPGDEVITTPLTCVASNAPIVLLGARPVWADVDPLTGNIDPEDVARKITSRTKAIIAVNWTGRSADYLALRENNIPVIEDAAHGPVVEHYPSGHFTCYSFGPIKHLTTGDGGGVSCYSTTHREKLKLLRWYGLDRTSSKDFRCEQDIRHAGMKLHMTDINAAIGLANLPELQATVTLHKRNALALHTRLTDQGLSWLTLAPLAMTSNYWVFPILVASEHQRDRLRKHLEGAGIASSQVHARNDKHTAYDFPNGPLPGLDSFDSRHLNIPCGWWVTSEDIDTIVNAFVSFKG